MVSHGEVLRFGYSEQMEYEPKGCRWLIQGILSKDSNGPYPSLPWKLGIMTKVESSGQQITGMEKYNERTHSSKQTELGNPGEGSL
jgi:hypothetical protein